MQYREISPAIFLRRPNRFVAEVELDGRIESVHVKNTGRCRELLLPGCRVYLERGSGAKRKTAFDLVAVEKFRTEAPPLLVNMDAQAPNLVFLEYLQSGQFLPGLTRIQPEYTYGSSRIDFYLERGQERFLVEVKGCTLEEEGICRFPDAPTLRGTRHIHELIHSCTQGYAACLCFVVQMEGMREFRPNDRTDPAFAQALEQADRAGVRLLALGCTVRPDSLWIQGEIPVRL